MRGKKKEKEAGRENCFSPFQKSYVSVYISITSGDFTVYKKAFVFVVFNPGEVNSFNSSRRRNASGSFCMYIAE